MRLTDLKYQMGTPVCKTTANRGYPYFACLSCQSIDRAPSRGRATLAPRDGQQLFLLFPRESRIDFGLLFCLLHVFALSSRAFSISQHALGFGSRNGAGRRGAIDEQCHITINLFEAKSLISANYDWKRAPCYAWSSSNMSRQCAHAILDTSEERRKH